MKKFETPTIEIEKFEIADVITPSVVECDGETACGTEMAWN